MPDKCPNCKQDFIIEPGFYTASLWISYPIVMLFIIPMVLVGLSSDVFFRITVYPFIVIASLIIQIPIMRLSRAILIHITVPYNNDYSDK